MYLNLKITDEITTSATFTDNKVVTNINNHKIRFIKQSLRYTVKLRTEESIIETFINKNRLNF